MTTSERPALAPLQRWMLAVITCPDGVQQGVLSAQARAALDVPPGALAAVIRPSASLSAAERLATYHRAYHARLLAAFRDLFPALQRALGAEILDDLALSYLAEHPPSSFTLSDLAGAFPAHLEATRPDRDAPPEGREAWPDFLIELARLECAVQEVAEGPGLEGRAPVEARGVLAWTPDELLRKRPAPAPCLRLFACTWPVHRYLRAVRTGGAPALPEPSRSLFALCRREYRIVLHDLSPAQHVFLSACDGRRTVAGALDALHDGSGGPLPEIGNLRDWLCEWASRGFFEALG